MSFAGYQMTEFDYTFGVKTDIWQHLVACCKETNELLDNIYQSKCSFSGIKKGGIQAR